MKPRKAYRTRHDHCAIVEAYSAGEKIRVIAEIHGIDMSTVRRIVRRAGAASRLTGRPRTGLSYGSMDTHPQRHWS